MRNVHVETLKQKENMGSIVLHHFFAAFVGMFFFVWGVCVQTAYVEAQNVPEFYADGHMIRVEAGYKGIMRLGRDSTFYIKIDAGHNKFNGEVIVYVPDANDKTVAYSQVISIPEESMKVAIFNIPVTNIWTNYSVELKSSMGSTVFYHDFDIEVDNDLEKAYVGIFSEKEEELSFLAVDGNITIPIDRHSLHDSMSDWNLFDIIVIDQYDMEKLSIEMFQNLLRFVEEGGTLVLGTGKDCEKILEPFIKGNVIQVDKVKQTICQTTLGLSPIELRQLKVQAKEAGIVEELHKDNAIKIPIADFVIKNARNICTDDQVLVEKVTLGKGNILVFHFSIVQEELNNHILKEKIHELIYTNLSEAKSNQLYYSLYNGNVDGYALNVVGESGNIVPPPITKYLIVTMIYIIVSGPILYLILAKMNKRKLIWAFLPSVAIVFTLVTYFVGGSTRNKQLRSSYFSILKFNEDTIDEYSVFNMTVPYNRAYKVSFDETTKLRAIGNKSYLYFSDTPHALEEDASSNYQRKISSVAKGNTIDIKNTIPYSSVYFNAYKENAREGNYENYLHFTLEGFEGGITNQLGYDLKDAFLVSSGAVVYLGDIDNGEYVQVNRNEGMPMMSVDYYLVANYVDSLLGEDQVGEPSSFTKSAAINFIVEQYFNGNTKQNIIIGFSESNLPDGITSTLDAKTIASGVEMTILPVDVDYSYGDLEIEPILDFDERVIEGGRTLGQTYRMFNGVLTMEYQLPKEDKITSFLYLDYLNYEYDSNTYGGFSGDIYFYNYRYNQFDHVFTRGSRELWNVSDYINEENQITIKYIEKKEYQDVYMSVPYISYIKEGAR